MGTTSTGTHYYSTPSSTSTPTATGTQVPLKPLIPLLPPLPLLPLAQPVPLVPLVNPVPLVPSITSTPVPLVPGLPSVPLIVLDTAAWRGGLVLSAVTQNAGLTPLIGNYFGGGERCIVTSSVQIPVHLARLVLGSQSASPLFSRPVGEER